MTSTTVKICKDEIKFDPFPSSDVPEPEFKEEIKIEENPGIEKLRNSNLLTNFLLKNQNGPPEEKESDFKEFVKKNLKTIPEEHADEEDNVSLTESEKLPKLRRKKSIKNIVGKNKKEEEVLLRSARICCIEGYLKSERFGNFLAQKIDVPLDGIRHLSNDQLEDIYKEIRTQMNYRYKEKFIEGMVKAGINITENLIHPVFPVPGFSAILSNDPAFLDCLEELKLELPGPRLPLSVRMGGIMFQTAILCNKMAELSEGQSFARQQPHPTPPPSPVSMPSKENFVNRL